MTPITAIGSVGEMSAPKSRQSITRSSSPTHRRMTQVSIPTTNVENAVPTVDSTVTAPFCRPRSPRSMCSAPAKSRKASIPWSRTVPKFSWRSTVCASYRSALPTAANSLAAISTSDSPSAITMTPMIGGSRT